MQAGDPAQPVQHSVITASSLGFFFRAVSVPVDFGSLFNSSGTNPGAFTIAGAVVAKVFSPNAFCQLFYPTRPCPEPECGTPLRKSHKFQPALATEGSAGPEMLCGESAGN